MSYKRTNAQPLGYCLATCLAMALWCLAAPNVRAQSAAESAAAMPKFVKRHAARLRDAKLITQTKSHESECRAVLRTLIEAKQVKPVLPVFETRDLDDHRLVDINSCGARQPTYDGGRLPRVTGAADFGNQLVRLYDLPEIAKTHPRARLIYHEATPESMALNIYYNGYTLIDTQKCDSAGGAALAYSTSTAAETRPIRNAAHGVFRVKNRLWIVVADQTDVLPEDQSEPARVNMTAHRILPGEGFRQRCAWLSLAEQHRSKPH